MPQINFYHTDCMEFMADKPDGYYDLAIVDPPYGIDIAKGGIVGGNNAGKAKDYGAKEWDSAIPTSEYFSQLRRVSKNQIIWGWNYFVAHLNECPNYIVWDKDNSGNFADCESAWCSKVGGARVFKYRWNIMLQQDMKNKEHRIHPTQKPVALYKWLLKNYAKPGDKILDTHGGSMSIAIACHDMGFDLDICELDKDYFDAGVARYQTHIQQMSLFSEPSHTGGDAVQLRIE